MIARTVVSNLKTKFFYILLFLIIQIGCDKIDHDHLDQSNFNLANDFEELTERMTTIDTIRVWSDLSSCMWMTTEKMIITKSEDSLNIKLSVIQMMEPEVSENVKIALPDSVWNFDSFLSKNTDRLQKTAERDEANMKVYHKSDSLVFYTGNLTDLNNFISEYYEHMFQLEPKNKAYQFIMDVPE